MRFRPVYTVLALGLLASGCATDFSDYEGATHRAALANLCEQRGLVSSDDFAHYSALQMGWGARQNMRRVDDQKMRSMYLQKVEQFSRWEPKTESDKQDLRMRCADITVVASRVKGVNSAPSQSFPAYTPPKTTNCMTTYGWTRCTTN